VLVDAHEMGPDVEFYFDPPTDPYPHTFPEFARWGFDLFNRGYAEAFDREGYEYMTGERYNYFYPAYTTSYGSYQGAVGMLYEQGSTRGLAMTRADGSVRTLRDALDQQYTAAWSAVVTAARNRGERLERYHQAHREAVADGESGLRRYVLDARGVDPHLLREVGNLLIRGGVEVGRLTEEVRVGGLRDREGQPVQARSFPPGSLVIETAQPRNRLVRVLLEPDTPVPQEFLEMARARVDRGENPRFYDVTAFFLLLYFNQEGYSSTESGSLPVERIEGVLSLRSWYETEAGEGQVPYDSPGPFFRGDLNRAYWLTAGLPDGPLPFQVSSARIYLAPDGPPSSGRRVAGTFDAHDPHISGHAWPETLERIPGSVFAYEERVGEGRVVALSEDVNFRSYWRGGQRLFLNAVVLGPSAP
jgi:hypothetical protein